MAPRDAATILVLREDGGRLEVFCVQRHANSAFMGGAVVFPGGKVDPADGGEQWATRTAALPARMEELTGERATARALGVAACREALEEGAILPVDGLLPDAEVVLLQREFLAGARLDECLEKRGLRLDLSALVPFSRWVTPEAEARRFDARFFLLALPAGQIGRHDDHETTMSFWATPAEVLERAARGEIFLAPPTSRSLELLSEVSDLRGAFTLAAQQCLAPICPRFVAGEPSYLALPGDPSHEIRERRSAGSTRYVLREGRFISEDPPPPGNP